MKIHFVSDVHLEFGDMNVEEMPNADILILAGDIAEIVRILQDKKKIDSSFIGFYDEEFTRCYSFFLRVSEKYEHVLYVLGNHESYHYSLNQSKETLGRILPTNVKILDSSFVDFPDFRIVGGTLWTDMDKENPIAMVNAQTRMSDYKRIEYHGKTLTPFHTVNLHHEAIKAFREAIEGTDKPCIVVSHHSPSYASTPSQFLGDALNHAYSSELSDFILDHDGIKFWIHGHLHDPVDYMIGNCRVMSNPRGYHGYEKNSYSKEKMIEI